MDPAPVLLTMLQFTLTGGVGGVLLVNYATKGLFLLQSEVRAAGTTFSSEYEELMWLAERQRGSPSEEETSRFVELRDRWPEMHADSPTESLFP